MERAEVVVHCNCSEPWGSGQVGVLRAADGRHRLRKSIAVIIHHPVPLRLKVVEHKVGCLGHYIPRTRHSLFIDKLFSEFIKLITQHCSFASSDDHVFNFNYSSLLVHAMHVGFDDFCLRFQRSKL